MTVIHRLIPLGLGAALILALVLFAALSPLTAASGSETQTPSNGQPVLLDGEPELSMGIEDTSGIPITGHCVRPPTPPIPPRITPPIPEPPDHRCPPARRRPPP